MVVEYLFDSSGEWICFKKGKFVYDIEGNWIGWLPWNDLDVVTTDGEYLGTICNKNRIYHFFNKKNKLDYKNLPTPNSRLPTFRYLCHIQIGQRMTDNGNRTTV